MASWERSCEPPPITHRCLQHLTSILNIIFANHIACCGNKSQYPSLCTRNAVLSEKKGTQELSKHVISISNKNRHVLRLEYSPHPIFWWNCSALVKIIRFNRCNSAVIVQRLFFDVVLPWNLLQWMSFYRFQKAESVKSPVVNYVKLTMWVY